MSHNFYMAQGKRARTSDILKDLGKRLRWAREIIADNQVHMCGLMGGIETSTWNRWERGHRYPDPVAMVRLCDHFGLTMDYLYRGDLRGVREDVAFRLAAYHPEFVERIPPAEARRAGEGVRAA